MFTELDILIFRLQSYGQNLPDISNDLREALSSKLGSLRAEKLSDSVQRLMAGYRGGQPATEPFLRTPEDVAAYAAYRMPATFGAARAAAEEAARLTNFQPKTLVDVGGGTGAVLWAATEAFPSLERATVLEQSREAVAFGKQLATRAQRSTVRNTDWVHWVWPGAETRSADLVTVGYVLGEMSPADSESLIIELSRRAKMLIILEPGTPAGYRRVIEARGTLQAQGFHLVAPCPHEDSCPMLDAGDWCHFSNRVSRSALHRRLKSGELAFEDEKFSYVVATRDPVGVRAPGRVVRHPQMRKRLVALSVCSKNGELERVSIGKSAGERYRHARDVEWGDAWPSQDQGL